MFPLSCPEAEALRLAYGIVVTSVMVAGANFAGNEAVVASASAGSAWRVAEAAMAAG